MKKIGIRCNGSINLSRLRYVIDFLQHHPCSPSDLEISLIVQESVPKRTLSEAEGHKSDVPNSTNAYSKRSRKEQKQNSDSILVLLGRAQSTDDQDELIFQIPSNNLLFENGYEFDSNDFEIDFYQFQNQNIYSVEPKARNRAQDEFLKNGTFGFDVFETIFFHISRVEEWNLKSDQLDAHNRMKATEMLVIKCKLEKTPIVDQLVFAFFEALGLHPKTFKTKIHLSHDVDMIQKFPSFKKVVFAFGSMILKQRSLSGFFRLTKQYFNYLKTGRDPFDTFDWLLAKSNSLADLKSANETHVSWYDSKSSHELEGKSLQKSDDQEYELAKKTIYILSGGEVPKIENHFDLNNPKILEIIELAKSRDYQIGIHPSYNAHLKKDLFKKEKAKLEALIGESITATRQHFLRWKFPETPRIIEELGLKTDSTLGFPDRIGFRCGTGFSYHLYDFENEQAFKFFEIPMVVMDVGLMRDELFEKDNSFLKDFLTSNSQNTLVVFNFHNSSFDKANNENCIENIKATD